VVGFGELGSAELGSAWLGGGGHLVAPPSAPSVLLQAVVVLGSKAAEGQAILAVAVPWFKIIDLMRRDPEAIYKLDWRKWEELMAGAYVEQGFSVTLTPRSNDDGRDIIATLDSLSVRFVDQVKAYRPGHLVTADEVRAMVGVLTLEPNVSKGIITTTADFAPGVYTNPKIQSLIPWRLELKPKDRLMEWLTGIADNQLST
jgi:restriction system protein